MPKSISSPTYTIKLFEDSKSEGFIEALNIYSDEMPSELRTSSNEIIYWLDNYNKLFEDELLIFGFYEGDKIIGFSQFLYFKKECFFTIDYFVIATNYRGNHSFQIIIALLQDFLKKNKFEFYFMVTEVNVKSKTLLELLKMNGFGEIQSQYFQPSLGINNYESLIETKLLYFPAFEDKIIKKETYEMIINTLYEKHYLRWYSAFLVATELETYTAMIKSLKIKILKNLNNEILVNDGKKPMNDYKEFNVQHEIKSTITILVIVLIFAGATLVLGKLFDMSAPQIMIFILLNTSMFFLIHSLVSNKNKGVEQFKLLLKLFDKVK